MGNIRVWLFLGDEPSDSGFRGSILYPPFGRLSGRTAYDANGAYVTSQGDDTEMIAHLVSLAEK